MNERLVLHASSVMRASHNVTGTGGSIVMCAVLRYECTFCRCNATSCTRHSRQHSYTNDSERVAYRRHTCILGLVPCLLAPYACTWGMGGLCVFEVGGGCMCLAAGAFVRIMHLSMLLVCAWRVDSGLPSGQLSYPLGPWGTKMRALVHS